ncbi:MAG: ABC transporter substrate-binding protein [Rhodoferax sp.]|nr:ABC transporter substrate-binding protein [Rhodoferax sp.]
MVKRIHGLALMLALLWAGMGWAQAQNNTIRVGVLEFGTVNWELTLIQQRELAKKRGIQLVIVPLASGDASTIALQGGAVDLIVSDWLWVSRQRAESRLFSFVTYSNAVGSVMVSADSPIQSVTDLQGRKLGVSGGPHDKIWLLLRGHALRKHQLDLGRSTTVQFGAPPLLNELILRQDLDAVLNTWPFNARLETKGMRHLIGLPEILGGLGVKGGLPLIGWVFREDWANANKDLLNRFFETSREAKQLLKSSDEAWNSLKPRMRAENDAIFLSLRDKFRAGVPDCLTEQTRQDIARAFEVLAEVGGEKLIGKSRQLAQGTFWPGLAQACERTP